MGLSGLKDRRHLVVVVRLKSLKWLIDLYLHNKVKITDGYQAVCLIQKYCSFIGDPHDTKKVTGPEFAEKPEPDADVRAFICQIHHQPF